MTERRSSKKIKNLEERTIRFIKEYKRLKEDGRLPTNIDLASLLGIPTPATITEILGERQNIKQEYWLEFMAKYNIPNSTENKDISVELELRKKIDRHRDEADLFKGRCEKGIKLIAELKKYLSVSKQNHLSGEQTTMAGFDILQGILEGDYQSESIDELMRSARSKGLLSKPIQKK